MSESTQLQNNRQNLRCRVGCWCRLQSRDCERLRSNASDHRAQQDRLAAGCDSWMCCPVRSRPRRFDSIESTGQFQPTSSDAEDSDLVFAGFDRDGKLVGLAIETQGMGYQDLIRLLYGYSPDEQAIIGIRVLESRETPGLGDRIETDANFLRNFQRLDVTLNSDGTQLAHPIEFVKVGKEDGRLADRRDHRAQRSRREPPQRCCDDSAADWIPRVQSRRERFRCPPIARSNDGGRTG